ncbi:MAG TPA: fructose-1,6-bisphosphate aldolase, partial [Sutterella sp.]|nr:fructose-1,6-bisphosphate aldolase [Sutterella sp.]
LHLDHGDSFEICKSCIDGGFSSVMIDASGKPLAENIEITRKVVDYAHERGVVVEAELGTLAGIEDEVKVSAEDSSYTRPEDVEEFVTKTGCDSLAIAIGTSHGAYKFTRKPTGEILSIQRVKEIHERLPNTHLVMHGSSSVPQEFLAEIRKYGGQMRETYGVPVEEIQKAIKHGVRKVNIDTDIRLAMTAAIRRFFVENPSAFDPRAYLKVARKAAYEMCKSRFLAFGCEGQAAKIKAIPMSVMAARYADGTLAQKVN